MRLALQFALALQTALRVRLSRRRFWRCVTQLQPRRQGRVECWFGSLRRIGHFRVALVSVLKRVLCSVKGSFPCKSNSFLFDMKVSVYEDSFWNRDKFLGCTWRHHFLKSKTKEPPKLLPSVRLERGKFISVNNFSAQEHASSKNQPILNFRVMAVRDIKLWTCLSRNIYLSLDF